MGSKCWPNKMGEEVLGYSPPPTPVQLRKPLRAKWSLPVGQS